MKKSTLSFVIPLYNEEESIAELYLALTTQLKTTLKDYLYEIIFIDDGSIDGTFDQLQKLESEDSSIKLVRFRRNLGKSYALHQGLIRAHGDLVVTLDGDLQDGPENIKPMIDHLESRYDMVVGWKRERMDGSDKTIPSKIFNTIVSSISGLKLHDVNSGLKVMTSDVAHEIQLYGELHRFIPVLAKERGFRVSELAVKHYPRKYGVSKYGIARVAKGFFDFITVMFLQRFGSRPLHLFGSVGGISITIGIVIGTYLTVIHIMGVSIGRRPLLTLTVLLIITGLQLLSIGLIAEMLVSRSRQVDDLPIQYETIS